MSPDYIVQVDLGERAYDVRIGSGMRRVLADSVGDRPSVIVMDEQVRQHWSDLDTVFAHGFVRQIPSGEDSKNWDLYRDVCEDILAHGIDRATPLFAVGGGVTGDLAGFVAASLLRGIPFVQVPTTLLAMVDSSVGGKVGINSARGKNLIGAFYQPREVVIDTDFLGTLPPREYAAGLAEIVKHALLEGEGAIAFLLDNADAIMRRDRNILSSLIARNVALKARIVAADEREETGARATLNFGHTYGHALESAAGYDGRLLHGEAVAIGMMHALAVSAQRGVLQDVALIGRIGDLLTRFDLPTAKPDWLDLTDSDAHDLMRRDKKAVDGRIRYILCRTAGDCFLDG